MPVWLQWVVFAVMLCHAAFWATFAFICRGGPHRVMEWFARCSASACGTIAALTLWFIAGGGK